jgi:hypothetical protein
MKISATISCVGTYVWDLDNAIVDEVVNEVILNTNLFCAVVELGVFLSAWLSLLSLYKIVGRMNNESSLKSCSNWLR